MRKHGGENVTMLAAMAAGEATGTVTLLYTASDWAKYGQLQDALMADPDLQAIMTDPNSPTSGCEHVPHADDPGHVTTDQSATTKKVLLG